MDNTTIFLIVVGFVALSMGIFFLFSEIRQMKKDLNFLFEENGALKRYLKIIKVQKGSGEPVEFMRIQQPHEEK